MTKIRIFFSLDYYGSGNRGFWLKAYASSFSQSDLGQIYQAIPWDDLILAFDLEEKDLGRNSTFSPRGKIALMFLKHYSVCSDHRLLQQLNANIHYQMFCGVLIDQTKPLKHRQIVSRIRGELAHNLDIGNAQKGLAKFWSPYMEEKEKVLVDATCYESEVRYPTDVKLLWESVFWLYAILVKIYRKSNKRRFRSKYNDWASRYKSYCRKRKPRVQERIQMTRGFLRLLKKLIGIINEVKQSGFQAINLKDLERIKLIETVYEQQSKWFYEGEKPKNRIISLAKPYLRPIVRGKRKQNVEFGAKVNKIQVDGVNFIEHINFEAFHEGIRLEASIVLVESLFEKVKKLGADAIYATNANRNTCKNKNIFTDFVPKGRRGKQEAKNKPKRKVITKERASRLEGSFGNEKNAYHLNRIRARTKENEILWIFFGIHTANAREIGKRIRKAALQKAA